PDNFVRGKLRNHRLISQQGIDLRSENLQAAIQTADRQQVIYGGGCLNLKLTKPLDGAFISIERWRGAKFCSEVAQPHPALPWLDSQRRWHIIGKTFRKRIQERRFVAKQRQRRGDFEKEGSPIGFSVQQTGDAPTLKLFNRPGEDVALVCELIQHPV